MAKSRPFLVMRIKLAISGFSSDWLGLDRQYAKKGVQAIWRAHALRYLLEGDFAVTIPLCAFFSVWFSLETRIKSGFCRTVLLSQFFGNSHGVVT